MFFFNSKMDKEWARLPVFSSFLPQTYLNKLTFPRRPGSSIDFAKRNRAPFRP